MLPTDGEKPSRQPVLNNWSVQTRRFDGDQQCCRDEMKKTCRLLEHLMQMGELCPTIVISNHIKFRFAVVPLNYLVTKQGLN